MLVAVSLALGLVAGIPGVQAVGPEVWLSPDVDQYPPREPQSALEFQMLMAAPRTPNPSLANINKNSALLWQREQCQLVASAELVGSVDYGYHPEASATLKLPHDVELRVSFLYDLTPPVQRTGRSVRSYLLFKYSMDYQIMPNLQVGLSGYLYQQRSSDFLTFKGPHFDESALGLGPGVKYDLGRWSFLFQSQVETGSRDRDEGINNWFRVWYAF
ncbi:MAG: transporter [Desulfobacca sp.]|nr:transporter [Desulfobacca sp.]